MNKSNRALPLLCLMLSAGMACDNDAAPAGRPGGEKPAVSVQTAPVQRIDLDRTVEVVGTLFGDEEVVVSAKVAGRVNDVKVDVGDRVAGGAVLAQIDPVDYELEVSRRQNAVIEALSTLGLTELPGESFDVDAVSTVARARLQAENAQSRMERARRLFEQSPPLISEQEYADLQTGYEVAKRDHEVARLTARSQLAAAKSRQSELEVAKEQLSDTRIVAPRLADGRMFAVATRSVSQGEYVREATAVFRLVLDDVIKFRGALPERFSREVAVGQTVTLQIAGQSEPVSGTVSRISPAVDVGTRTFQIEALFANTDRRLKPGAFARGSVIVGKDTAVPAVPEEAVVSFAGVDKVFSVKDGAAAEHDVKLGPKVGGLIAIRDGLENIDTVITKGVSRVSAGAKLEITSPASTQSTTAPSTAPATAPAS